MSSKDKISKWWEKVENTVTVVSSIQSIIESLKGSEATSKDKAETSDPNSLEGLAALYSGVSQNLTMLHDADTAIENKTLGLFAASIVALTILIDKTHHWGVLPIIGLALLGAAILASLFVISSRGYHSVAVSVGKNPEYLDMDNEELLLQLIVDADSAFDESAKILVIKAKAYNWILALFTTGFIISLLSLYIKIVKL